MSGYNRFEQGTDWERPFTIEGGDKKVVVATAVAYDPQKQLDELLVREGGVTAVQFTPGVLTVR